MSRPEAHKIKRKSDRTVIKWNRLPKKAAHIESVGRFKADQASVVCSADPSTLQCMKDHCMNQIIDSRTKY